MGKREKDKSFDNLPDCAGEYIQLVIRRMGYRRKAREEVRQELIDHFEENLKNCRIAEEKERKAQQLICEFGDAKLLAVLMRRAKKRCRPMWQKVLVRGAATTGVIIVYLFICVARLQIGSPTIRVNYAQWLTDEVRQGRDESLNARPEIDKAANLVGRYPKWSAVDRSWAKWPGDMNEAWKAGMAEFVAGNTEALDTLSRAMEKPYYWGDYSGSGPLVTEMNFSVTTNLDLMETRMGLGAKYREVGKAMAARISWRAYTGDINGAVNDTITLCRFGYCMEGQGFLIDQLVAVAIEALALSRMQMMATRADVPAEQLKRLQDEVVNVINTQRRPTDLTGEKALWYDTIQHAFTDDGKGDGRVLKGGLPYIAETWHDAIWEFVSFSYPTRAEFLASVENFFETAERSYERTPWQAASLKPEDQGHKPDYLLLGILRPAYERVHTITWRLKVDREATSTILAIVRFKKERGRYAEQLDELVQSGYLARLPSDPFGDGAMRYKRAEDGFLLYSWGENLKDDGGQAARDEKGRVRKYAADGDWVFWPAEKNEGN